MSIPIDHINQAIISSLEKLSHRINNTNEIKYKSLKISKLQSKILKYLLIQVLEKRNLTTISDQFKLSKATVSESLNSLLNKKLITRYRLKTDRRSFTLSLTAIGQQLAIQEPSFTKSIYIPIQLLKEDEKQQFLETLLKLEYAIEESDR